MESKKEKYMSNLNKKTSVVNPIRFELVEEELKYLCWMCRKHHVSINGSTCPACIAKQAKIEKELLEGAR